VYSSLRFGIFSAAIMDVEELAERESKQVTLKMEAIYSTDT
jgi:hypothetical protein